MEKFGMTFGGGPNKKELLDTIENQKQQLIQYRTRFKDVVRAYKSLMKEKEALEASLKVLTVSQEVDFSQRGDDSSLGGVGNTSAISDFGDDRCSQHSEDSLDTVASADTATSVTSGSTRGEQAEEDNGAHPGEAGVSGPLVVHSSEASGSESGISSSSSGGPEQPQQATSAAAITNNTTITTVETNKRILQLKNQLTILTSSLTTVTQEKSRMEASFQADKRIMKQELEELHGRLEDIRRQQDAETQFLQEQLTERKARIITQQHEREQEQSDHALMLCELQKLLQEERDQRQDMELRLEDTRAALLQSTQAVDRGLEHEAQLKQATEEREALRRSLLVMQVEKNKPDPHTEELQQELTELKIHFQQQLQHEIRKATQAEEHARDQAQAEEGRVASLEERVSELSELLGVCEKARQRDQQNAHKLKERILQLDMENKTLAIAAASRVSNDLSMDDANLNVNALKEKLEKVKRLLLLASQGNPEQTLEIEKLADIKGELGTGIGGTEISDGEKASALYYQQELRQLKEEFERYKVRAQVVLKNKNTKDGCQAKELEETRDKLAELKEKYINLRIHSDEAETKHRQDLEEHQQQLLIAQQSHKQDLDRAEAQHRENLLKLEGEMHKQRDRTMALLAEKDNELEKLRSTAIAYGYGNRGRSSSDEADRVVDSRATADGGSSHGDEAGVDDPAQDESGIIAQALRLVGPNEPTLLLYAEQLARKEVEIGSLRRQKRRLEEDVHQLQGKLVGNGERYDEEMAELRIQLDKLLRDQGREGANLEYLKNVIYKFLTLHDSRGRQQTLNAILTILHFSPQEKQAVFKLQGQTWWQAGMR